MTMKMHWKNGLVLGVAALVLAPLTASASDDLTRALRAKIDELRRAEALPTHSKPSLPPDVDRHLTQALRERIMAERAAAGGAHATPAARPHKPHAATPHRAATKRFGQASKPVVHAPEPEEAPADPLRALTAQYKSNQISPRDYHRRRAELVGR